MGKHFSNRLTKWLPKEKLDEFIRYQMIGLGELQKDYIIKRFRRKMGEKEVFAVFLKRAKPLPKNTKLSLDNAKLDDLLAFSGGKKLLGISILKTLSKLF